MNPPKEKQPLFPLGRIVATPGALAAIEAAEQSLDEFIHRHHTGDWGDLEEEDIRENEFSLKNNLRLLSAYHIKGKIKIWLITEADRSVTTILLPDDY